MNIIDNLEKIISLIKDESLTEGFLENAKEYLKEAGELLDITPIQTAFFAIILDRLGEDSTSLEDISKILNCNNIELIRFIDDLETLKKKKLIRPVGRTFRYAYPEYVVPVDVIQAIRKNERYEYKLYQDLSAEEFFECVASLFHKKNDDEISTEDLIDEINDLVSRNKTLSFSINKEKYGLNEGSLLVLFVFCCALLEKEEEVIDFDVLESVLCRLIGIRDGLRAVKRLKSGEHKLMVNGLLEFDFVNGMADAQNLRLTDKAKEDFLAEINMEENVKKRGKYFILGESINVKPLFYNNKINSRINELTELLKEENFSNIKKRLTENGMRTGFACLFSGPPGTGKTETAYQIARETKRDIMVVDISDTKSMWFGESEKKIKALFNRYKGAVKQKGLTPILLFNEADAVLGKRRELSENKRGPDQTENAIQNIILQEIESFNGILIATTNMVKNFDKAFERRFLYKIEFENPDIEAKKSIWKSHIKTLCDPDAEQLAKKFDFSGGQIENIARKSTVSYILKGTAPDFSVLETFCKEEQFEKCENRIGFILD